MELEEVNWYYGQNLITMKTFKHILIVLSIIFLILCLKYNAEIRDWCIALTFNSICFIDNSFNISGKSNPILIWSIIFALLGMCYGMIRAVNRFNLNRLIMLVGILVSFLLMFITVSISKPLKLGNSREVGEKRLWDKINTSNSYSLSIFYLTKYPQGKYESQVRIKQEQALWDSASISKTISTWSLYIQKFPDNERSSQAKMYHENLLWNDSKKYNTTERYNNYISKYPNGMFTSKASLALKKLQRERERILEKSKGSILDTISNVVEPVKETRGKIDLPGGRKFEGILIDGVPNGKGTEIFPDNTYLEGTWVNGKRQGVFILHNVNGTTETQEFENGNRTK